MFNIGLGEMVLIGIIALIFIGPKQLPVVARTVGRFINDIKRAADDLTGDFVNVRDDINRHTQEAKKELVDSTVGQLSGALKDAKETGERALSETSSKKKEEEPS